MASSRDDFIIAIRSAFLKKSTQQKFSLLSLVFISIFTILLSSLDFRVIRYLKIGINELINDPIDTLTRLIFHIKQDQYITTTKKIKKEFTEMQQLKKLKN